jgi:hypothetical protein
LPRHGRVEDLVDQRGLARTGNTGHRHQQPQRDVHGEVVQIVFIGVDNGNASVPDGAHVSAGCRRFDFLTAAQVTAGERSFPAHDLFGRALGHDFAPQVTGTGTEVHDPVRRGHGFPVMLHHDKGVADVAEMTQGAQQFDVVPLVQADGGLVQNVEDAGEFRTHLGGQADALRFAAGQGRTFAAERQVVQSHVDQKTQPAGNFLEQFIGDDFTVATQLQSGEKILGFSDGHLGQVDDGAVTDFHGEHLGLQAPAATGVAGPGGEEAAVILFGVLRFGLLV